MREADRQQVLSFARLDTPRIRWKMRSTNTATRPAGSHRKFGSPCGKLTAQPLRPRPCLECQAARWFSHHSACCVTFAAGLITNGRIFPREEVLKD